MMQPMSLSRSTGHLLPAFQETVDQTARIPHSATQHDLPSYRTNRDTISSTAVRPLPPHQDPSYQRIIRENQELRKQMALLEQCAAKSWSSRRKATQTPEKRKRRVSKLPLIRLPPRTLAPLASEDVDLPTKSTESEASKLLISGAAVETYQRVGKDTSRRPMIRRTNAKPSKARPSTTPSIETETASAGRQTSIDDDVPMTDGRSLSSIIPLSIELPPITEFHFSDDGDSSIGCSYEDNAEPLPFEIPRKKALPRADETSAAWHEQNEPPPDDLGNCPPFTMLTWVPWPEPACAAEAVLSAKDTSSAARSAIKPTSRARSRRRLFSAGPLGRTFSQSARSSSLEEASHGIAVISLAESAISKPIRLPSLIGLPLASPILHRSRAGPLMQSEDLVAPPTAHANTPLRSPLPETPPVLPDLPRRPSQNYRKVTLGGRRKLSARKRVVGDIDGDAAERNEQSWDSAASIIGSISCSADTMEVDLEDATREGSTI